MKKFTTQLDMQSNRITDLGTPTLANHGARVSDLGASDLSAIVPFGQNYIGAQSILAQDAGSTTASVLAGRATITTFTPWYTFNAKYITFYTTGTGVSIPYMAALYSFNTDGSFTKLSVDANLTGPASNIASGLTFTLSSTVTVTRGTTYAVAVVRTSGNVVWASWDRSTSWSGSYLQRATPYLGGFTTATYTGSMPTSISALTPSEGLSRSWALITE